MIIVRKLCSFLVFPWPFLGSSKCNKIGLFVSLFMIEFFILKISFKSSKTTAIHMLSVFYSVLHNFLLFAFVYKLLLIKCFGIKVQIYLKLEIAYSVTQTQKLSRIFCHKFSYFLKYFKTNCRYQVVSLLYTSVGLSKKNTHFLTQSHSHYYDGFYFVMIEF